MGGVVEETVESGSPGPLNDALDECCAAIVLVLIKFQAEDALN